MLSEALAATKPQLRGNLVEKLRQQAALIRQDLERLGGSPSRPFLPLSPSAELMESLRHWAAETSIFREELEEWNRFLLWCRRSEVMSTTTEAQEKSSIQNQSRLKTCDDLVGFRRQDLDHARSWVDLWQQEVEQKKEQWGPTPEGGAMYSYKAVVREAQSGLANARKEVNAAIRRLEDSLRKRAHVNWDYDGCADGHISPEDSVVQLPPSLSQTASVSSQSESSRDTEDGPDTFSVQVKDASKSRKRSSDAMSGSNDDNEDTKPISKRRLLGNGNSEKQQANIFDGASTSEPLAPNLPRKTPFKDPPSAGEHSPCKILSVSDAAENGDKPFVCEKQWTKAYSTSTPMMPEGHESCGPIAMLHYTANDDTANNQLKCLPKGSRPRSLGKDKDVGHSGVKKDRTATRSFIHNTQAPDINVPQDQRVSILSHVALPPPMLTISRPDALTQQNGISKEPRETLENVLHKFKMCTQAPKGKWKRSFCKMNLGILTYRRSQPKFSMTLRSYRQATQKYSKNPLLKSRAYWHIVAIIPGQMFQRPTNSLVTQRKRSSDAPYARRAPPTSHLGGVSD